MFFLQRDTRRHVTHAHVHTLTNTHAHSRTCSHAFASLCIALLPCSVSVARVRVLRPSQTSPVFGSLARGERRPTVRVEHKELGGSRLPTYARASHRVWICPRHSARPPMHTPHVLLPRLTPKLLHAGRTPALQLWRVLKGRRDQRCAAHLHTSIGPRYPIAYLACPSALPHPRALRQSTDAPSSLTHIPARPVTHR